MRSHIEIAGRCIGAGEPAYIVAEMSANHNHDYEKAKRIIGAAKDAGADAVKIQTYTPDTMTLDCNNEYFTIGKGTIWEGRTLYDLYREAHMPWEWQPKLKKYAEEIGIDLFSTPFDNTAVDYLEEMGVPAYKIASFELVDLPLIKKVAKTGKPIIMSTGMATLDEIDSAVDTVKGSGGSQIVLMKCTSAYPAPLESMNLRTIANMAERYSVPVGLSDHSMDIPVAVAAVALGAAVIEKHMTLSRSIPGPDSQFSLEPQEFKRMVDAVRSAEKAIGKVSYEVSEREAPSRIFRRSLFISRDISKGDLFSRDNIRSVRPAHGMPTSEMDDVIGRVAACDLKMGTPLCWDHVKK